MADIETLRMAAIAAVLAASSSGEDPDWRVEIFCVSMSAPTNTWPISAKPTALERPTYPVPVTAMCVTYSF